MKALIGWLTGLLLLSTTEAQSQTLPPAASTPRVFTRADTLQALHSLFLANRRRGRVMTGLAPVLAGVAAYSGSQIEFYIDIFGTGQPDTTSDWPAVGAVLGGFSSVALAILGPSTWGRNSKEREREAVRLYEQHQPLPKRVQRQLHRRLTMMLERAIL
ncbi:hypothetical protein SAMN06265337_2305 [Hymenobacter gelipurpurascens]|uniref:Uncharacterized protein n=1 Tax=Hymenobacter gelipurpurascens TaxID=89968 RepID=A0A212TQZ4_9BACT|nr:hypothetical protein [Hymenobacter gelipurpurascens]SNC68419.1 hypothetical protein SAMN06265337_2305 [Hymenobacter gelipurpurascens]